MSYGRPTKVVAHIPATRVPTLTLPRTDFNRVGVPHGVPVVHAEGYSIATCQWRLDGKCAAAFQRTMMHASPDLPCETQTCITVVPSGWVAFAGETSER